MLRIVIKIQSISDIITNSSSEVFCTITSKDVKAIYQVLEPFFPGNDDEFDPTGQVIVADGLEPVPTHHVSRHGPVFGEPGAGLGSGEHLLPIGGENFKTAKELYDGIHAATGCEISSCLQGGVGIEGHGFLAVQFTLGLIAEEQKKGQGFTEAAALIL